MLKWQIILSLFLSLIVGLLSIGTFIYLSIKRNTFPYSNISPLWTLVTLISKIDVTIRCSFKSNRVFG